jgi:hypothetical protein
MFIRGEGIRFEFHHLLDIQEISLFSYQILMKSQMQLALPPSLFPEKFGKRWSIDKRGIILGEEKFLATATTCHFTARQSSRKIYHQDELYLFRNA